MIREDFIQYLWGAHLIPTAPLKLSTGEVLDILSYGEANPYFNARLRIGSLQWAGNVEMHTASSLWYAHHHEQDPAYGNVILHVVWEHDVEVFDFQQNIIPTLELKSLISNDLVEKYTQLQQAKSTFIPCEREISSLSEGLITNWLDRLYTERLEEKTQAIATLLQESQQDWEAVFFLKLLGSFGGRKAAAFFGYSQADAGSFSVRSSAYGAVEPLGGNRFELSLLSFPTRGIPVFSP